MNISIIGAGVMGHGIAQIFAMNNFNVFLVDINKEALKKAIEQIRWSLKKFSEKKIIKEEEINKILSRIKTLTSIEEAAKNSDFIVEAVPEKIDLKKQIFKILDENAPKHAILATNTSSLSITEISEVTKRPEKVIGMHFFNPPQLMKLVEVIKGKNTSEETIKYTIELCEKIGKKPILVKKDVRGFIVNRILHQFLNEAFWSVYRKETTIEEIDSVVKYIAKFPMGAFELADYIGLDIVLNVSEILEKAYGLRAKVCPIIKDYVKEEKLGRKTMIGFYDWSKGRPEIKIITSSEYDVKRLYSIIVNEAAYLIYEDVSNASDIDIAMKLGAGWSEGPCEIADRIGIDQIFNELKRLYERYNEEMYNPCKLLKDYIDNGRLGIKSGRGFYEYK
ncbi:MAG: 3-hydroxyacyl-CoA dehydrogenase [Nitrososphaerota archaeon]